MTELLIVFMLIMGLVCIKAAEFLIDINGFALLFIIMGVFVLVSIVINFISYIYGKIKEKKD